MILVLQEGITREEKGRLDNRLEGHGCIVREISPRELGVVGAAGRAEKDAGFFEDLPGVERVIPISTSFKLVSRRMHPEDTVVRVRDVEIGGDQIVVVAGPCAVESREQAFATAREVRRYGAVLFRGGAFKPRTSPYSFQGLELEGLKILAHVREEFGLPVVTEMTATDQADSMVEYVDVVQIGARNMQNFELLKCVGRIGKPVLLKRGLSATIEEWLMSAEYIFSEGNDQVILCERGIRTFERYTRNTLDLSAIPIVKELSHLPIIVDPSHATGMREKVAPMARSAVAAGADGLMIEVHHDPDTALSDGPQSLYPKQFGQLMRDIYVISPVVGKQLDFSYSKKRRTEEEGREQPDREKKRAAFLGVEGTFSHKACNQFFGNKVSAVSLPSFRSIFEAVKSGEVDFGVLPLENSLTGSIHENYDFLLEYDLRIVGEATLRVVHNLIGLPGTKKERIRRVLSHPQVFQQCRLFLEPHHEEWALVSVTDTAKAARLIRETGDATDAAIGSQEEASIHGLEILEEGIETNPRNFTRFVVIGKEPLPKRPRSKSSLIFSTVNESGALYRPLKVFADQGINLVKLESRPIPGKPWEYMFYVDLEEDVESPGFQAIMKNLEENTDYLKVLGSY
jgi:3-deoxy-7-phosphoheptulonate synthase